MRMYTVVGMYRDNCQVYVTSLAARNVAEAVAKTKKEASSDMAVLSVFAGEHQDIYGEDELLGEDVLHEE